jgi:hypothetical protein
LKKVIDALGKHRLTAETILAALKKLTEAALVRRGGANFFYLTPEGKIRFVRREGMPAFPHPVEAHAILRRRKIARQKFSY